MNDVRELEILRHASPLAIAGGVRVFWVPDLIERKRTWWERLFSRPWRPGLKSVWTDNPAAPPKSQIWGLRDMVFVRESDKESFLGTLTDVAVRRQ